MEYKRVAMRLTIECKLHTTYNMHNTYAQKAGALGKKQPCMFCPNTLVKLYYVGQ